MNPTDAPGGDTVVHRRGRLPIPPIPYATDVAGLAVRAAFGPALAYHGWQKLDRGTGQFADFVGSLEVFGVGLPEATGYFVVWLELAGGVLLTLGLLTRVVALLTAVQFLMIPFVVKSQVGLIGTERTGFEIDLFIAAAVALVVLGPGRASVDHLLGIEGERPDREATPATPAAAASQRRPSPAADPDGRSAPTS